MDNETGNRKRKEASKIHSFSLESRANIGGIRKNERQTAPVKAIAVKP